MPPLVKPISFSVASSSARKGWRADWDLALDTAFLASHRCIMGLVAEISVMLFAGRVIDPGNLMRGRDRSHPITDKPSDELAPAPRFRLDLIKPIC
jgi:hypothetical protein